MYNVKYQSYGLKSQTADFQLFASTISIGFSNVQHQSRVIGVIKTRIDNKVGMIYEQSDEYKLRLAANSISTKPQ